MRTFPEKESFSIFLLDLMFHTLIIKGEEEGKESELRKQK